MTSANNIVRNAMAANARVSKNAKFIGRPPARVKQLVEQMDRILEVTEPNDTTDRMMGEVLSLGWDWDDARKAWRFDDSYIKGYFEHACQKFMEVVKRNDLAKSSGNLSDKTMAEDVKRMIAIASKYAR